MMQLTTKGRYAARIMIFLARYSGSQPATKHNIAENEKISANYVEQIMIRLKDAHLIVSHRGRNGGFSLARQPDKITVADVLKAVEGPVALVPCVHGTCERQTYCSTRPVWKRATDALEAVFVETTIDQMAKQTVDEKGLAGNYSI